MIALYGPFSPIKRFRDPQTFQKTEVYNKKAQITFFKNQLFERTDFPELVPCVHSLPRTCSMCPLLLLYACYCWIFLMDYFKIQERFMDDSKRKRRKERSSVFKKEHFIGNNKKQQITAASRKNCCIRRNKYLRLFN